MHRRRNFPPVAHDGRVSGQLIDLRLAHGSHRIDIKALESRLKPGPFAGDHRPRQTALEHRLSHHFQVVVQALGDDPLRGFRMCVLGGHMNVCLRLSIFLRLAVVTSATSSTETPLTSAKHCATSATCRGSVQLWRYFLNGCGKASVSSTMFSSGIARAASCTSGSRVSGTRQRDVEPAVDGPHVPWPRRPGSSAWRRPRRLPTPHAAPGSTRSGPPASER